MAASVLGLTATQLTVLFGALGVGIGFGLQNIVNNLVSGLILVFEQPLKVGDRVEASGNLGIVKRIGVRATVLRTFDGAEVIVPNSDLTSKEVTNWTLSDPISRIEVRVGVAYGSDPDQVIAVLRQVATENSRVLREPEPLPLMVGFGDSSLDFRLLCWTRDEDRLEIVSEVHLSVNAALRDAGIEIPFPQRDLHVKSVTAPLVSSSSFPDGEIIGNRSDGPHETVRKVRR
jgi:small-conductance mechanosensitive channel